MAPPPAEQPGLAAFEAPLQSLERLAKAQKTGEYVLATGSSEIHIYLQRGRFAWATDSRHPYEFLRHLQLHRQIDDQSIRHVIEVCRSERRPLGETLIEWKLATLDEVRASLQHQVLVAVRNAARATTGGSLFLARPQFHDYDERLTFGLHEILDALGPVSSPSPVPALPPNAARPVNLVAARIMAMAPSVANVRVFRDGHCTEDAPAGKGALRPSASLAQLVLSVDCDFAAIRTDTGSVVGAHLGERTFAFASIPTTQHYGQTIAALRYAGWTPPEHHRSKDRSTPTSWSVGDPACAPGLADMIEWDREMLAVVVADARGNVLQATGRATIERAQVSDWLVRRLLPFAALGANLGGEGDRHFGLGDAHTWAFGAHYGSDGHSAWLLIHRRTQQGLGWAGLNAELRLLGVNTRGGA
jgi:hypothetical protein